MRRILKAALLASATGLVTSAWMSQVGAAETMAEERVAIREVKEGLDELIKLTDQAQRLGNVEYQEFKSGVAKVKQALKQISDNINGIVRRDIFRLVNKARSCARKGDYLCAENAFKEARRKADKLRAG